MNKEYSFSNEFSLFIRNFIKILLSTLYFLIFSFISMLRGLIDTMQEHGITDKITVQIFKHQALMIIVNMIIVLVF